MNTKNPSFEPECAQSDAEREKLRRRDMEHSIAEHLMARYGPVLDSNALVETLKFPSKDALERSLDRGHLRLPITNLPNRRGRFALAQNVARYLVESSTDKDSQESAEDLVEQVSDRPQ